MRFKDLNEDGVIVPGVNTTVDVKPGQTEKEAAKFFGHGKPKELHAKARKNSDPNTLYNMGLAESKEGLLAELWRTKTNVKQSDPLTVLDNLASRKDDKAFPVKMYDGSVIEIRPSTARRFIHIYLKSNERQRDHLKAMLKTKAGFREMLAKIESVEIDDNVLAEAWSEKYKRSIDCSNPKGFSQKAHCDGKKKNEATNQYVLTPHQNLPNTKSMTGGTTMVTKSFKKMQQQQANTQSAVDARQGAGMSRIGTAPKIKQSDFSPEVFPQRTGIKKPRT